MDFTEREKAILSLLKKAKLSPSHGVDHSINTACYATFLSKKYKGNRDITVAASILHDLGRIHRKLKGKNSAHESAKMAKGFLQKAKYTKAQIREICDVISEHDQPELHSKNINSRILKDADFIEGFGARGILRAVMHTGETGGSIGDALKRLKEKMRRRMGGLEFLESKRLAWKLRRLTELFLEELKPLHNLSKEDYGGKLIVLEGISGSGKNTQAELLYAYLKSKGYKTKIVNYPTEQMKKNWAMWRKYSSDPMEETYLMLADRLEMTKKELLPFLNKGYIVISTRSSLSSQAYQYINDRTNSLYRFSFNFEPIPDILIYLNSDSSKAYDNAKKVKGYNNSFFKHKQNEVKKRYKKALPEYPNVVIINAMQNIENVHENIISTVNKIL
ncbi:MAG: dTMP kinase [Candidatus Levybacteria bacterium]|nr:dTMP kinase [Candidatus Levybacteria bacterium]